VAAVTGIVLRVALGVLVAALLLGVAARFYVNPPGHGAARAVNGAANPDALRRHVEFLCASPRSHRDVAHLDELADYIARELERAGGRVTRQPYAAEGTTYQNVVARLGPETGDVVVVGAHYDAFGPLPGADDNASGVAVLLEAARLLRGAELGCRVEAVAYTLEEPPYFGGPGMGSAVHAASLDAAATSVRGALTLEMLGYFSDRQPWPATLRWLWLVYPRHGHFVALVGRPQDRALARTVKGAANGAGSVPFHAYVGPRLAVGDLSDHRNYWERGFPALMLTDTAFVRNPNYHTPHDTPETLDYERMAQVARAVASAVATLAAPR